MIRKQIAGLLVVTVSIAGSASIYRGSCPPQSEDGVITLRMAQTSSETGAIGQSMNAFVGRIYERTGGKYKIEVYHNGQLEAEIDTTEGRQMGTIDITAVNQSTLGNLIPDFPALGIPYLVISTDQVDQVFLGEIGNYFLDELSGVQLYGLGIRESGFRNLTNSETDVNSVDDTTGLRIRTTENQIHIIFRKALRADATSMAWGEAYTALQQGVLDGQKNPSTLILTNNVAQVSKHMAVIEHAYSTAFLVMSLVTWASLDEKMRQVFQDTVIECGFEKRKLNRKMDVEAVEQLREQGIVVIYLGKQQFIEVVASLHGEWEKQYRDIMSQIRALQNKQQEAQDEGDKKCSCKNAKN